MIKHISQVIDGLAHCVQVDSGKIASYTVDGFEFIHQRVTGWPNSDTEMFPIIGPTAQADYRVQVNNSKKNTNLNHHETTTYICLPVLGDD